MNRCVRRRILVVLACAQAVAFGCSPRDAGPVVPDAGFAVADAGVVGGDGGPEFFPDAGVDGGPDGGIVLPPQVIVVRVDEMAPRRGPVSGGVEVTIAGRGFLADTVVTIGGAPLLDKRIEAERRISGRVPPGVAGVAPVLISNSERTVEVPGGFTYFEPVMVSGIAPDLGPATGGTEVSVIGTGFVPGTTLLIGARPAYDVRVESAQLVTAVTPPGTPGAADVSVVNPFGLATRAGAFTYLPRLTVDAVEPPVGPLAGGNTVRILGGGFDGATRVFFASVEAGTVAVTSASELEVIVPPGAAPGAIDVSVVSPRGAASRRGAYAYVSAGSALRVDAVLPASGPTSGGTAVWVIGSGFDAGVAKVLVGGAELTGLSFVSSGILRGTTPAGSEGPADVVVVTGDARDATLAGGFRYTTALTVTAAQPAVGPARGGTEVVISGQGFAAGAEVFFGPLAAGSVQVEDPQTLRAIAPPAAAGAVDITVRVGDRSASLPGGFAYYAAPKVHGISPVRGAVAGGTFITITGAGFGTGSQIFVGGVPAVETKVVNDSTMTLRSPPGPVGFADVLVVTGRGVVSMPAGYEYFDPTSLFGGTSGAPVIGAVNVTVFDGGNGERLSGAFATLSTRATTQYQGITNASGQVVFSGPDLSGRQVVSVGKEGYTTTTVVGFDAENITVILAPLSISFEFGPGGNLGVIRGKLVSAFKAIPPPPDGYQKAVVVTTSMADRFTPNPQVPGAVEVYADTGLEDVPYEITSRLGNVAVYALAGHLSLDGSDFTPYQMGIRRHLFVPDGGFLDGIDLEIDIGLVAELRANLIAAPPLREEGPNLYRMRVFLELGSDGTVFFFRIPESADSTTLVQAGLPVIAGVLPGASYTVVAGAYTVEEGQEFSPLSIYVQYGLSNLRDPVDLGPMMALADPIEPKDVETIVDNRLAWSLREPPEPSYTFVYVLRPSGLGFSTIWEVILPGNVRSVDLPDLRRMAGLTGFPPSEFLLWAVIPVSGPQFTIDAFDYTVLGTRLWQAYSSAPYFFITPP